MWGLIVSLLFLSPILDGFQALDGSGRPLPHAVLTFLRSGTTIPKAVYADQDLEVELSDAAGRVTADAQGRFPLIYLAADPTPRYRVMLHTAQGVLRWDIDPYVCDCTDPPYLFRSPKHQALDEDGRVLAASELVFTLTETETPAAIYADADRAVPLPNPLTADAGGFFPPIYLDDDVDYRVRLSDRHGELVLDVDPYICECGFLLRTSRPYSLEQVEALDVGGVPLPGGRYEPSMVEALYVAGQPITGGELRVPLVEYQWQPAEALQAGGQPITGGEMRVPLVEYAWPMEELHVAGEPITGGELRVALQTYEWPGEEIAVGAQPIDGGELV